MPNDENKRLFVVGLGNPGRQYQRTRHNIGFDVLAELRKRWSFDDGRVKFHGKLYDGRVITPDGRMQQMALLAPRTFMNRSGSAVAAMATFYRAQRSQVLVVMDDMDLPLGMLRARANGSAGGHKGLSDILAAMGGNDVPRLRVGIGRPAGESESVDFVLGRFSPDERDIIDAAILKAADAVEDWLVHGMNFVMEKYNRKADDDKPRPEKV